MFTIFTSGVGKVLVIIDIDVYECIPLTCTYVPLLGVA